MLLLINLEDATERRARMAAQLAAQGLAFERIGFDGRRLTPSELRERIAPIFPRLSFDHARLSGAEIGCWLSHLLAWRRLLDSDVAACTVIEDDLLLTVDFGAVAAALQADDDGYDLVYLGTSSRNLSTRRSRPLAAAADGATRLHETVGCVFNTWGYVVRRRFAERWLAAPHTIRLPIDHILGGRVARGRPKLAVVQPAVVAEEPALARASQIEPYTHRLDRAHLIEATRRRFLESRAGDLFYRLYRWL